MIKQLAAVVGLILALSSLGGLAWATMEVRQEVAANTNYRLLDQFERLELIRKQRKLTKVEWLRWCEAGIKLQVFSSCPAR